MTQGELAAAVGVSLRTVGNWERGASVPQSREAAIEDALGLAAGNIDEVLAGGAPRYAQRVQLGQATEQGGAVPLGEGVSPSDDSALMSIPPEILAGMTPDQRAELQARFVADAWAYRRELGL